MDNKAKINMNNFYPANMVSRVAFKTPILLWRLGLGSVIGQIIMIITTTGYKSGQPRHTPVEYYTLEGKKYVTCGFGAKAAWYKNIQANPYVTIQTSGGTEHVLARRVNKDDEIARVYQLFQKHNPLLLNWYLQSLGIEPNLVNIINNKEQIYWLSFDPVSAPTPLPVKPDLVWIWLTLVCGLISIYILSSIMKKR